MKGIVAKPMPKHWYDEKAAAKTGDPVDVAICANRKPYFMIYRYPELRSRYLTYDKGVARHTKIATAGCVDDPGMQEWADRLRPAQHGRGVVNRICHVCEQYFKPLSFKDRNNPFDASILKSGVDYSRNSKDKIAALYHEYMERLQDLVVLAEEEDEFAVRKQFLRDDFMCQCMQIVADEAELCDIVVDICYGKEKSKQFAWDMCGEQMVRNVLRNAGGEIYWPKQTARGDIVYSGKRFRLEKLQLEESDEGYCAE